MVGRAAVVPVASATRRITRSSARQARSHKRSRNYRSRHYSRPWFGGGGQSASMTMPMTGCQTFVAIHPVSRHTRRWHWMDGAYTCWRSPRCQSSASRSARSGPAQRELSRTDLAIGEERHRYRIAAAGPTRFEVAAGSGGSPLSDGQSRECQSMARAIASSCACGIRCRMAEFLGRQCRSHPSTPMSRYPSAVVAVRVKSCIGLHLKRLVAEMRGDDSIARKLEEGSGVEFEFNLRRMSRSRLTDSPQAA